jgi:hypothetical protein
MLITFTSKASAEVLMKAEHAIPLLQMAGKDLAGVSAERGVFTPEQLGTAIAKLEHAISQAAPVEESDEDHHANPRHGGDMPVRLDQRAYPLLDMLKQANEAHESVLWEASSGY